MIVQYPRKESIEQVFDFARGHPGSTGQDKSVRNAMSPWKGALWDPQDGRVHPPPMTPAGAHNAPLGYPGGRHSPKRESKLRAVGEEHSS